MFFEIQAMKKIRHLENVKHMVLAIMTFSNIQQFQVKSTWNFLRFSNYALE
jgi:hypothetical protein